LRYYVGLAVAIVAISFSAIFIRLAEAPAITVATGRMAIAVLLLIPPLALFEPRGLAGLSRRDLALCALSGAFLAAHFGLWTASLDYTSVASSVVFVSTHPIFVAIAAALLFRERMSGGVLGGIGLAFAGSLLIGLNDLQVGGEALFGDLLAVGGAAALVGYLLIGKALRGKHGFLTYSVVVYFFCTLALAASGLLMGVPLLAFSTRDLLLFFALAAVSTLGGHTVFNWALRHLSASVVAVSFVGEPAGSAFLAWLILAEPLAALTAAGGALMLVGIYVTARGGGRTQPPRHQGHEGARRDDVK
jgi:drug/metabolite transporter (DMT)-like permease